MVTDNTPDERQILDNLRTGKPIRFPSILDFDLLSLADQQARTIPVEWIAALVDENSRSVATPVEVDSAIIEGDLTLVGVTFTRDVAFSNCRFAGTCDISEALFERRCSFSGSQFLKEVDFSATRFSPTTRATTDFRSARFDSRASFDQIEVGGNLRCEPNGAPTRFGGPTSFVRAAISGDLVFTGVECHSSLHFDQSDIGGNVFLDAEAERPALLAGPASFQEIVVHGNVQFGRARLDRDVSFQGARLLGDANFDGTLFGGWSNFERAQVTGTAFFAVPATGRSAHFASQAWFVGATIGSDLSCSGVQFDGEAHFERVSVRGKAVFLPFPTGGSPTRFGAGASFSGSDVGDALLLGAASVQGPLHLIGARIGGDVMFQGVWFGGDLRADRLEVGGTFYCDPFQGRPAVFSGAVNLTGAQIHGDLACYAAHFLGEVQCERMSVGGNAFFSAMNGTPCCFQKDVSFQVAFIKGHAYFPEARFHRVANFRGLSVAGDAYFYGAHFKGPAVFDRLQVAGLAYFLAFPATEPVIFDQDVSFLAASIGGDANFSGSEFHGKVQFDRSVFRQNATFSDRALPSRFMAAASFNGCQIDGVVQFEHAIFLGPALFGGLQAGRQANFFLANFAEDAVFLALVVKETVVFRSARFRKSVTFALARIGGFADLPGLWVDGTLNLGEAHIAVIVLEPEEEAVPVGPAHFAGTVLLDGLTYERVVGNWRILAGGTAILTRPSAAQLEKTLRAMGEDSQADAVYLEWKRQERMHLWTSDPLRSIGSVAYWAIAHYGIRPYRLAGFALFAIVLGAALFAGPGAVTTRTPTSTGSLPPLNGVGFVTGIGVSLNTFLPVDTPAGSQWRPSDNTIIAFNHSLDLSYSAYGTIERLCGWVVVPLGVAAIAGFLNRRPKG
jgi:uncharacterized protein YjbI with pentapeptide repeats